MSKARSFASAACALVLAAVFAAGGGADGTITNPKHIFWAPGQDPTGTAASVTNDIIYHGGNVGPGAIGIEKTPAVYLVYWGPAWVTGFDTVDANGQVFSSKSLQNYLNSFFQNVGGSSWAAVQTQYCRNVPAGTTSCAGIPGADFVTNPKHQLKGVWTDPTPVPDAIAAIGLAQNLVDDPIAMEAMRASAHFNYDPDATYVVLTPPQTVATGQPVYCGYHTQTTSVNGLGNPYRLQYAFIPYLNRDWTVGSCGANSVNATSNSFGNGVWDGYSIVVGHEYSEAVTDPDNVTSIQDGWNDDQTSENADKCAWYHTQNITLAGHQYAIQPTWSNEAFDAGKDGCAVAR